MLFISKIILTSTYIYFTCLSVCLYPMNVKMAEPIWPDFLGNSHDPREGLRMIEFSKIFLLLTKFFLWKYWKSTIFFKSAILFHFVLQFLKRKCSHMKYYKMKLKMSICWTKLEEKKRTIQLGDTWAPWASQIS